MVNDKGGAGVLVDRLLGPLHMHFRCAGTAYADYLANGRTFLWARSLERLNAGCRSLLLDHGHMLPEDLQEDAAALVRHYDVWLTLWHELAQRARPALDEGFVFKNDVTFPRAAQQRLELLYESLRSARAESAD